MGSPGPKPLKHQRRKSLVDKVGRVVELADTQVLGACAARRAGSSPASPSACPANGRETSMTPALAPSFASLKDLTRIIQRAEGFHPVVAALKNGHGATVDGAWGSSNALVAAALGLHAPRTLLVVIAHPGDLDAWIGDLATFSGLRPTVFPAW